MGSILWRNVICNPVIVTTTTTTEASDNYEVIQCFFCDKSIAYHKRNQILCFKCRNLYHGA